MPQILFNLFASSLHAKILVTGYFSVVKSVLIKLLKGKYK